MDDTELVRVHVTNAHVTSGGTGPGVVTVPLAEANDLVARRYGRILAPDEDPAGSSRIRRGVSN